MQMQLYVMLCYVIVFNFEIFYLGDKVFAREHTALNVVYEGEVIELKEKDLILVKFKNDFVEKFNNMAYVVEFDFARASFVRMHFAIDMAIKIFGMSILNPKKITFREKPLLDIRLNKKKELRSIKNGKPLNWFNNKLNDNQKETVACILRGDMLNPYVIYGPPGKIIHT